MTKQKAVSFLDERSERTPDSVVAIAEGMDAEEFKNDDSYGEGNFATTYSEGRQEKQLS